MFVRSFVRSFVVPDDTLSRNRRFRHGTFSATRHIDHRPVNLHKSCRLASNASVPLGVSNPLTVSLYFRTLFKKSPKINGKDIDLYLLYVVVTAHGGWIKVSRCLIRLSTTR